MQQFNLGGIYSLRGVNKERLSINCFLGKVYFSIFTDDSPKPFTLWVSDNVLYFVRKYIREIMKDTSPNKNHSILISEWNADAQTRVQSSSVIIGRDAEGKSFLKITSKKLSNNGEAIFYFFMPQSIELGEELTEQQRNEYAIKIFLDVIERKVVIADILSRDAESMLKAREMYKDKQQGQQQGQQSSQQPNKSDEDIPF